ncbi:hypothetical protein DRN52_01790 [Thermococci archaeon]|nr:MAG: hypothetical protein DRN52_01790 [Thermococci archaeon]
MQSLEGTLDEPTHFIHAFMGNVSKPMFIPLYPSPRLDFLLIVGFAKILYHGTEILLNTSEPMVFLFVWKPMSS